jgi:heme-degrading monooxygenase HmoA
MILEVAVLYIIPGNNKSFEADFKEAGQYISSIEGYIKHSLQKCLEQPNKYVLLVEWETLEDHTVKFRQSAAYQSWRELLHHHYDPFPLVEHFEKINL